MGRDWIIDVLADLRRFARDNELPLLTAQLEEARLVAEVEIASLPDAPNRHLLDGMQTRLKLNTPDHN